MNIFEATEKVKQLFVNSVNWNVVQTKSLFIIDLETGSILKIKTFEEGRNISSLNTLIFECIYKNQSCVIRYLPLGNFDTAKEVQNLMIEHNKNIDDNQEIEFNKGVIYACYFLNAKLNLMIDEQEILCADDQETKLLDLY